MSLGNNKQEKVNLPEKVAITKPGANTRLDRSELIEKLQEIYEASLKGEVPYLNWWAEDRVSNCSDICKLDKGRLPETIQREKTTYLIGELRNQVFDRETIKAPAKLKEVHKKLISYSGKCTTLAKYKKLAQGDLTLVKKFLEASENKYIKTNNIVVTDSGRFYTTEKTKKELAKAGNKVEIIEDASAEETGGLALLGRVGENKEHVLKYISKDVDKCLSAKEAGILREYDKILSNNYYYDSTETLTPAMLYRTEVPVAFIPLRGLISDIYDSFFLVVTMTADVHSMDIVNMRLWLPQSSLEDPWCLNGMILIDVLRESPTEFSKDMVDFTMENDGIRFDTKYCDFVNLNMSDIDKINNNDKEQLFCRFADVFRDPSMKKIHEEVIQGHPYELYQHKNKFYRSFICPDSRRKYLEFLDLDNLDMCSLFKRDDYKTYLGAVWAVTEGVNPYEEELIAIR